MGGHKSRHVDPWDMKYDMKTAVVLIAGSYSTDDEPPRARDIGDAIARQPDGKGNSGLRARGDLKGSLIDVTVMKAMFEPAVERDFLVSFEKPGNLLRKEEVVEAIKKAMQSDRTRVHIRFSGHGRRGTGDWCFENSEGLVVEYISFEELLTLWRASGQPNRERFLVIAADCCFSGGWVRRARDQWRAEEDGFLDLSVACAASEIALESDQCGGGGLFTKWMEKIWWLLDVNVEPLGTKPNIQHPILLNICPIFGTRELDARRDALRR